MAKMVTLVVVLAVGLYGSWFVKLGDRSLHEHLLRIASTPEAHELGDSIVNTVASAKTAAKTKIIQKLAATKQPDEGEETSEASDSELDTDALQLGNPSDPLRPR